MGHSDFVTGGGVGLQVEDSAVEECKEEEGECVLVVVLLLLRNLGAVEHICTGSKHSSLTIQDSTAQSHVGYQAQCNLGSVEDICTGNPNEVLYSTLQYCTRLQQKRWCAPLAYCLQGCTVDTPLQTRQPQRNNETAGCYLSHDAKAVSTQRQAPSSSSIRHPGTKPWGLALLC